MLHGSKGGRRPASGRQAPQDVGDAPVLARALLQHQLEAELRVAALLQLQTALGLAVLDGASLGAGAERGVRGVEGAEAARGGGGGGAEARAGAGRGYLCLDVWDPEAAEVCGQQSHRALGSHRRCSGLLPETGAGCRFLHRALVPA